MVAMSSGPRALGQGDSAQEVSLRQPEQHWHAGWQGFVTGWLLLRWLPLAQEDSVASLVASLSGRPFTGMTYYYVSET